MSRYQKLVEKVHAYLTTERDKKGFWSRFISDRFFDLEYWAWHRRCVAVGAGWGACFAIAPVPLQSLWGAGFAVWKRGNVPVAILCAWLSPPGFSVIAVSLQWLLGSWLLNVLGFGNSGLTFEALKAAASQRTMASLRELAQGTNFPLVVWEFVLGTIISCTVFGLFCYGMVQVIWQVCSWIRRWLVLRRRARKR